MTYRPPLLVLLAALSLIACGCQQHARSHEPAEAPPPATGPAPAAAFSVSAMRIRKLESQHYCYVPVRTSFQDMAEPTTRILADLGGAAKAGSIHPTGPALFIYHDASEDAAKPFDLEVGFSVSPSDTPPARFRLRQLPAFDCATVTYRGPMRSIGKAYEKLIPQIIAAGHVPSAETRESYLAWQGPDSPNNVVEIEVGIEGK